MTVYYKNLVLDCGGKVYEPAEDSILLADSIGVEEGDTVLDVGTGSGIVALAASSRASFVVGVDVNVGAVRQAAFNAKSNNIQNAFFAASDLFSAAKKRFDLITFNPPYLPVSEEGALEKSWSGGAEGLEVLERFIAGAGEHLKENGRIEFIVSSLNNIEKVRSLLESSGFEYEVKAEKKIFFEKLGVLSARKRI